MGHVRHKLFMTVAGILAIIMFGGLFLYYPLLKNAGTSHGYTCSRRYIYLPTRLDFKGCRTVTGTIQHIKVELDGDTHIRLVVDKQFAGMLMPQNYKRQHGALVIEDTCHASPRHSIEILAKITCAGHRSSYPDPIVGKRYEITGNYVVDDWHGSWTELHQLSELKQLN